MERYARGLAAGTDPGSAEAWPRPDQCGQAKVEAASIALILQMTRPWLWDRLDEPVRERVADWLATVVGQPYPPINWVWFRIVTESFLREIGGRWSAEDLAEDLAVHASLRREGGWLSDGQQRAYDHYVGWALHLYPLLWAQLFDVVGPICPASLRDQWAADLRSWLADTVNLVGADGSPLIQGRSLIYRFAAAAPFWVSAFTGAGGLPPGQVRRVASGMLRHFVDHGALGDDDLLRLGWHRPWEPLRQAYSGPGSPYWASKGMLGLALPADHAVWTSTELCLPGELGDVARIAAAPGWMISVTRRDGLAIIVNHGTDHALPGDQGTDAPLYARLGYSTATSPLLTETAVADQIDNTITLLDAAGRATHRSGFRTHDLRQEPGGILIGVSGGQSRWVELDESGSPDHGSGQRGTVTFGPWLTVASVLRDGLEVRLVRADDAPGEAGLAGTESLRLGGWPLADDVEPQAVAVEELETADLRACEAEATTENLRSLVRDSGVSPPPESSG